LPGFKGVSLYQVIAFVIGEANKYDITTRANSMAFSFFIALFPAIIFLFTLIPYLPISFDFLEAFKGSTNNILPHEAHRFFFEMLDGVIAIDRTGLRSVGFFLALFFSSSGMLTLMTGFDKTYPAFAKRSFLKKRFVALNLTILIAALFIVSLILIVFGKQLLMAGMSHIQDEFVSKSLIYVLRLFVTFIVIYTGITSIYRWGPSMVKKVAYWNPGALVATSFSILTSLIFAYFVNQFGRYNEIYGSIGALIVIMIWMQINAFIIIIGFELNASIAVNDNYLSKE